MLNGEQKNALSPELISSSLLSQSLDCLSLEQEVYVVHDGSDIRKTHAKKMESLTKVKDLSGNWVNGYNTFDSIAISDTDQKIHLLSCSPYSQGESHYNSMIGGYSEQEIIKRHIQQVDKGFKERYQDKKIYHILDRKHDDITCFETIDDLESFLVIRLKLNRNSTQTYIDTDEKERFLKLKDKPFAHQFEKQFDKFFYKNTLHTQCKASFSYEPFILNDRNYWVVKVIMVDRKEKNIFNNPMIIITNEPVTSDETAYKIFKIYLKRSKIENVFKFLKEALGWEEFQVQHFLAIQNIIALAFYVGAYFYEIQSDIVKNYQFKIICQLAKCKGKFTRHFFLQGLVILAHVALFEQYVKENNLSPHDIEQLMKMAPQIS